MKNYPFAEARVRRETEHNPQFRAFLNERNTNKLTRRRGVVSETSATSHSFLVCLLVAPGNTSTADHPTTRRGGRRYPIRSPRSGRDTHGSAYSCEDVEGESGECHLSTIYTYKVAWDRERRSEDQAVECCGAPTIQEGRDNCESLMSIRSSWCRNWKLASQNGHLFTRDTCSGGCGMRPIGMGGKYLRGLVDRF